MKTMTQTTIAPEYREKVERLLGSILRRRARAAALTLGYWATLLLLSFFK